LLLKINQVVVDHVVAAKKLATLGEYKEFMHRILMETAIIRLHRADIEYGIGAGVDFNIEKADGMQAG
jgi:hypothetical protein